MQLGNMTRVSLMVLAAARSAASFVVPMSSTTRVTGRRTFVQAVAPVVVTQPRPTTRLFSSATTASSLPDLDSMKAGELKKELESYGISTKSFLEKSELKNALSKARAEGKTPISNKSSSSSTASTAQTSTSTSTSSSDSANDVKQESKSMEAQMKEIQSMKATEIKKELESLGVSTKSFFEKSEFVKALAEARVNGVSKSTASSSSSGDNNNSEGYAEYKNVEVLTDDQTGPRKKQSQDQQSSQPQQQQQQSPFGGANPFGGGGMPGGMGGMGGIADMLKNMGGMGGGGAGAGNPFGGAAGGNPMGKAQEMMKNPRIMALMAKAQSNPKLQKIMTECMGNPAAMAKYANDPEVAELINELKTFM